MSLRPKRTSPATPAINLRLSYGGFTHDLIFPQFPASLNEGILPLCTKLVASVVVPYGRHDQCLQLDPRLGCGADRDGCHILPEPFNRRTAGDL
jgi:hypothetical protein